MYREAERFSSIRYDVTRIPALDLCGELNKTFGHVHPKNIRGTGWPEAYEVLEGTAHFLMQKVGQLGVDDAILLLVKKGEAFLVPPNYGHITINAGKGDLVMGNLVSDRFQSDYSMFAQRRGGCYYETTEGKLVRNRNYGSGFELRQMGAREFSDAFGRYPPFSNGLLPAAKDYDNIEFLEKPELFY
jgi:glucose-6-phosphate isomerase